MGFFDKLYDLIKRSDNETVTVSGDVSSIFGTSSDYTASVPDVALKISTVYRCVDIKASTAASLGLRLMRRRKADVAGQTKYYFSEDVDNHLNLLLKVKPNSRLNAYDFIYNLVAQIDLLGNAYVLPRYQGGEIADLVLLSPDSVNYDKDADEYDIHDIVNKVSGRYGSDDIIHLKNVSLDGGYTGVSTLSYAASTLNIALKTTDRQNEMYKAGSTLRGFVSGDASTVQGFGSVQDSQLETVSTRINSEINSGKQIFSLPGVMRFNQLGFTPAELQLLESKHVNVLEICRFFGVPPEKVFENTSTNYKASENSQTVFMTDTLHPLISKIQTEMSVKLLGLYGMRTRCIRFDLDSYYESDPISKAEYYQKRIQNGTMTPNEVRAMEGMPPIEGGDTMFISCNVAPIDSEKIKGGKGDNSKTNV